MREPRLAYYYAQCDVNDGFCYAVSTSINPHLEPEYIEIDSLNEEYLMKYYNRADGKWYEDAGFTIPWSPSK